MSSPLIGPQSQRRNRPTDRYPNAHCATRVTTLIMPPPHSRTVALSRSPPLVLLVGEEAKDHGRIDDLIDRGCLVVLAPSLEIARVWLPQALGLGSERDLPRVILRVDHLEIDLTERRVRWFGTPVALTDHEFQLLVVLAEDPGRARTFNDLCRRVWGATFYGDIEVVHAAVKRLRKKLRATGITLRIESVRGVGFRLSGPSGRLRRFLRTKGRLPAP